MQHYQVIIVGAGFAGLECAKRLAEQGIKTLVLDRKKQAGQGMHTTGILVKEAADMLELPEQLVRRITDIELYAPNLKSTSLQSRDYFFLTTDTPGLMQHLSKQAEQAGAEVRYGVSYTSSTQRSDTIILEDLELSCDYLIGADGPRSKVAEDYGLGLNTEFLLGAEVEFENTDLPNSHAFYCFLDQVRAYGYIGWAIPGVGITQVGVATRLPKKPDINEFVEHLSPMLGLDKSKIVGHRGGLIPVGGVVKPFYQDNVILLGDSAGLVSPFSAGGIHTALYYGRKLADAIVSHGLNESVHPTKILEKDYPNFRAKHCLRFIFEKFAPNWALNLFIGNPLFKLLAQVVFYKVKRLS